MTTLSVLRRRLVGLQEGLFSPSPNRKSTHSELSVENSMPLHVTDSESLREPGLRDVHAALRQMQAVVASVQEERDKYKALIEAREAGVDSDQITELCQVIDQISAKCSE